MHKKTLVIVPVLFTLALLAVASPALAYHKHSYHSYAKSYKTTRSTVQTNPAPQLLAASTSTRIRVPKNSIAAPATTTTAPTMAGEIALSAYVTGYSYWDNTPAGTADISHPVIHKKAGGTGTFADLITLAVGHSIIGGKDILDYPAGTKFYLPYLQKYAIVEDTCGDGNSPQNGPCHTGYKGNVWIDIYVDGSTGSSSAADNCMDKITDVHSVIVNPKSTYPVLVGSVIGSGCKIF